MGLRILTNVAAEAVMKNLRESSENTSAELERLSSGKRIIQASDDAAGLAIATNLHAQTSGLKQATRNANDGISFVQTAEGGLNEVSNILIRLRELAIQSASDTVGAQERGFLDEEYQQLTTEIDRISGSTKFNGTTLLDGKGGGVLDFHIGAFSEKNNTIQFDSREADVSTAAIGISGTAVNAKGQALDAVNNLDDAINTVSGYRAKLGAIQNRLQSTVSTLETQTLNQDAARSTIEDVDVADSTAKLASARIINAAGVSTLAQANAIPSSALKLIG
ncbi:MAG: flagellin [Bdellovibrionales bacterium RIFOXYD12_FULL_39_22]|nr:MAG: flagellin [Bdellovibrionales bacterium RIFOXYB1_FULL_39_21]OFZ45225.1 MAG: flagellin [Bdellovibrionales bacterium RIFOXYC12_FULL_39_17]OFZ45582.1 MAG: flagellin [Bdellovibrionales bacterium RIFOXYC1_FULL_39_130]OFZ71382.1 MAG: flagellin [Bdellovibrionales bacterium RIFOXYC2_FULL_39_8]OFZ77444.1 MAG: flagellin [Bdellovibrionales bacterium RIFOXYD1_FULL_39_84]OFZ91573.1 MAG: flagellin [Bdellovibrionales bacterium RIFOXYD12_FULL_39_22]HLE11968.1 flagellin [Bacteriovoracaceae bacterium]